MLLWSDFYPLNFLMYQREFHKRLKNWFPFVKLISGVRHIFLLKYLGQFVLQSSTYQIFSFLCFSFCFLFLFLFFAFLKRGLHCLPIYWWLLNNLGNGRHDHKSGVICNGLNSHPVGNASLQVAFQLGIRHSMPSFISSTPTFELARAAPLLLWLGLHCTMNDSSNLPSWTQRYEHF